MTRAVMAASSVGGEFVSYSRGLLCRPCRANFFLLPRQFLSFCRSAGAAPRPFLATKVPSTWIVVGISHIGSWCMVARRLRL